jgi:RNA polymerase sigma-70 factor (ECF subfamily)
MVRGITAPQDRVRSDSEAALEARGYSEATAERIDLDAALALLPEHVRLCVVLAYNEGLSHPEIAALTDMPLGTVKSHIARGAARLREILADYDEVGGRS